MRVVDIEDETFSAVDAAWLHMDTPTNLATITGVIMLDRAVEFERLKATIEIRLLVHRRFFQRVHEPALSLGLPHWDPDPEFDLDRHLVRVTLPEPAGQAELHQMVSELLSQPLDPAH